MRILVNGCSFSRGPISWPYYLTGLTDKSSSNVVNLACAGAGNTYIHDTTMRILEKEKFDLVLIMWSGIHRIDQQIELTEINQIETTYSSKYQSSLNDWPEKIVDPFNDQTLVEKNWLFRCGVLNRETSSELNSLFKEAYSTMGDEEFVNQFIVKIIGLQNTLKQLAIPYAFSFYQDYVEQINHSTLIDWDNCIINDNITNIAKRLNSYDEDGFHPGLEANKQWANCVVKHLTQKNII